MVVLARIKSEPADQKRETLVRKAPLEPANAVMETCFGFENSEAIPVASWICFHVPLRSRGMPIGTAWITGTVSRDGNSGWYDFAKFKLHPFRQSTSRIAMDLRLFPVRHFVHRRDSRGGGNGCN